MRELTSSELRVLINELKAKIEGGFLRKFYDLGGGAFRFGFYREGRNVAVYCKLLVTFNETMYAETGGQATQFAIAMRRRIEGLRLLRLYQHGADRIIVMDLEGKGLQHRLIIEMFGKGNMVLVDGEGITELAYTLASYRERVVKPRTQYALPKSSSMEIEGFGMEDAMAMLDEIRKDDGKLISKLSRHINIGPLYLEDIILRAGMDPRGTIRTDKEAEALAEGLTSFARMISRPEPLTYSKDGAFVDYAIAPIRKYEGLEKREYGSLCELLDALHSEGRFAGGEEGKNKALEEIDANIKRQMELAEQTKADAVNYAAAAHRIFENMNLINSVIAYMRENKRATLEDVRKEFGEIKIKEIDLKNKIVKMEI